MPCTVVLMSIAEFEEKEFEGSLNNQLGLDGPPWTPGQVLEQFVGFDVAMRTVDAVFWAAQGFVSPPPGVVVQPAWWQLAISTRQPPPFQMNVFLQHKRPEYLTRSSASEWNTWKASYFRFLITTHQQVALEACATALGKNGLVAYACPAFYRRSDLWNHGKNRTLVANTHFAPASKLTGHSRYTYRNASTAGVAHSEPARVPNLTFLTGGGGRIDGPPGEPTGGGDGRPPRELLAEARAGAQAAIAASPGLVGSEELYDGAVARAQEYLGVLNGAHVDGVRDFIYTATFSIMSGISWLVLPVTVRVKESRG